MLNNKRAQKCANFVLAAVLLRPVARQTRPTNYRIRIAHSLVFKYSASLSR